MIIIDCDKCYKEDKQGDVIKRTAGGWGILRRATSERVARERLSEEVVFKLTLEG